MVGKFPIKDDHGKKIYKGHSGSRPRQAWISSSTNYGTPLTGMTSGGVTRFDADQVLNHTGVSVIRVYNPRLHHLYKVVRRVSAHPQIEGESTPD
jgi:hypothetical protein